MIESYQKLIEMESVATLKLEQDKKALEKVQKILYQEKNFILDKLIAYLKKELNIDYFKYKIVDIDGNIADILVKKESALFKENVENRDFVNFNAEDFIDKRMFNNNDEIIITDFNFDDNLINLGYLCDSLNYKFLSYSDELKDKLSTFVNYLLNKNLYKN